MAAIAVGALAGVAMAAVLSAHLGRSFDFDEAVSVHTLISSGSPTRAFTDASAAYNNHPYAAALQNLWWHLGGVGEARQRLLPIAWTALATGLLAGWLAGRWGRAAGAAAAIVLVANPLVVSQARLVRGYSLTVLGVVLATIGMFEYVRSRTGRSEGGSTDGSAGGSAGTSGGRWSRIVDPGRWPPTAWLVIHGAGAAIAVGTHVFAAIPLGALGVGLLVAGAVDRRLVVTWVSAAVAAALPYVFTFSELREFADLRGSQFRPAFARLTTWEVLGRDRLTGVVFGGLAVFGVGAAALAGYRRDRGEVGVDPQEQRDTTASRRGSAALGAPAAVVALLAAGWFVWQVWKPFDLYARFFIAVVPFVALLVARAVRSQPWLLAVVVVGGLATVGNVRQERDRVVPIREVAVFVDEVRELGLSPCVVGTSPLAVYTVPPPEFGVEPGRFAEQFAECDVLVAVGSWARPIVAEADAAYSHRGRVAGGFRAWSKTDGVVDGG